ncbi:hypothetical protein Ple7327_0835 [Pleurocapsa sp. PCC 7327]|nr:hypothetical protein Ple7327_0835 [Pleurocapsa sp. PCC 7327]
MLPSNVFGRAVDYIERGDKQDFSSLMPRPGWGKVPDL